MTKQMGPTYKMYQFYGVELPETANGTGQFVANCPFCEHEDHFYISEETGMFQCKDSACGKQGNPYTFLEEFYQKCLDESTPFSYKRLSTARKKFPKEAYIQAEIAHCKALDAWLIPYRNPEGRITNLSVYNGSGAPYTTPGCTMHLYGLETLEPTGPVFICEGQWDAIALRWLLRRCENKPEVYTVLAVPGATTMPKADIEYLKGRDVYLMYDNDDAGRNGIKHACKKLNELVTDMMFLIWPESTEDGYDIEDYIKNSNDRPDMIWNDLLAWCFRYQKGVTDPTEERPQLVRTHLSEIIKDYEDSKIYMYDGLTDLLTLTCAVVLSTRLQGEPLWMYAIGDPGAGKSLVLESTLGSRQCIYRTSITHKAFVSGFRDQGEDRSLLSLLPGRALIVKDYSNVLSLPHMEQDQLVSLLREAFDGRIIRSYGNNVYREYPPPDSIHKDCRFSFVAGVTKEIHSRSHAGLGERFLKYEIPRSDDDNIRAMHAALDVSWRSHERQVLRSASVGSFLDRNLSVDPLPKMPQWFLDRIMSLSQFVGLSRSPVSRTDGDLDFDPSPESGTRVAKQLLKLAQSVSLVLNLTEANEEVYRLVRKVAWDTSHGWRRSLFLYLHGSGESTNTHKIADGSLLSVGTCHRQLHDMLALHIVRKKRDDNVVSWGLTPEAHRIIEESKLEVFNK